MPAPRDAREQVFRLLKLRPRSTREVEEKLRSKGFDAQAIDETVAWAQDSGLLDDRLFARLWVEDRLHRRPASTSALRFELKRKGIVDAFIEEALSEAEIDERALVRRLVEQRLPLYNDQPKADRQRKLAAYLQRRGFQLADVFAVLDEVGLGGFPDNAG